MRVGEPQSRHGNAAWPVPPAEWPHGCARAPTTVAMAPYRGARITDVVSAYRA